MVTAADHGAADRRTGARALLAGASLLAGATMAASLGNYGLNVALGRWLGAGEFSDANLMVTLMLLVTAAAVSLQLVASRFTGRHDAAGTPQCADRLGRWLERRAAAAGAGLGLVLIAGAPLWSQFFQTRSAWPFAILGAGMPFYLAQGVGRGVLQGRFRFGALAVTFVVEMIVRVSLSVALVWAGFGVEGATIGLTSSFVATWIAVRVAEGPRADGVPPLAELREVFAFTGPVALLLAGQIVINNGDILIVKHGFEPELAGAYAGVALIGRAVFFLSWSVVTAIFPATTQRHEAGGNPARLVAAGLGAVAAIGVGTVVASVQFGESVLSHVLGDEYAVFARYLPWYAAATSLFAVANLMASYELSVGRGLGSRIVVAGAAAQTVLLLLLRGRISGIVLAQVVAMAGLAGFSLVVVGRRVLDAGRTAVTSGAASPSPVEVPT